MIKVSVIMHEGMDGPHLFHIFVKSSDPENRVTVLKVKADIVPLETWRRSHPGAFYLPREVATFTLHSETEGIDAMAFADRVFGHHGPMQNAYLGRYGKDKQKMHLLVSEYPDAETGTQRFSMVIARLEKTPGISSHLRKIEMGGYPVYAFENGAHDLFYFQRANKVVWLYPEGSSAKQSLEEVLQHMQMQGL